MLRQAHFDEFKNILDGTPERDLPTYIKAVSVWLPGAPYQDFCPYVLWATLFLGKASRFVDAKQRLKAPDWRGDLTPLENVFWGHWVDETSPFPDIRELVAYAESYLQERSQRSPIHASH